MGNHLNNLKVNNKKYILQFIPKELEYLTESKKIEYKGNKLKSSYLVDIVHRFITKRFFSNKTKHNLSSTILQKTYGNTYKRLFEYLIDHNIIKVISSYFSGKKCITYSLEERFYSKDCELIRIKNDDKIILKKWKYKFLEFELESYNDIRMINETVKKSLIKDLHHVDLDFEKASKYLLKEYQEDNMNHEAYWKNQLSIESIQDGSLFYVEDDYGRFHTNFTILKKGIREECIKIGGEDVMELDIKNSQPTFLAIYLKEMGFNEDHPKEYERFKNSVSSGMIYEEYMGVSGWSRKKCKEAMYTVLFGKNCKYGKNAPKNKFFEMLYPEIYKWLKMVKDSANNHKIIAHELQRRESNLIFDHICYKFKKKRPDAKLFTVHDSIYFSKKHKEKFTEIFYNHIDCLFG